MENQPAQVPLEPMWTVRRLAQYLSLSPRTIYGWIMNGKITTIKFGHRVRISRSEVERIVREAKEKLGA